MCVVAFRIDQNAKYPFVLIGNRDEFHTRPSNQIHQWDDKPSLYAGKDLKDKGTWLGVSKNGKVATILNNPLPFSECVTYPKSRGQIVLDSLGNISDNTKHYLEHLQSERTMYRGYHLLFGTLNKITYYNNIDDNFKDIVTGLHSFSNTHDDLSSFRVLRSKEILAEHLKENASIQVSKLVDDFHETQPNPELVNLPDFISYEEAVNRSSLFIQDREFGTVSTTVLYVDQEGIVNMFERRYDANDNFVEKSLTFSLETDNEE